MADDVRTGRPSRLSFDLGSLEFDDIGPERIELVYDARTGMRGVVVIDHTRFMVAGGGVRMARDISIAEVARLARAMSFKYAMLEMPCGGAKAGIWLDPRDPRRDEIVQAFAESIRPLAERGAFYPAADMGTSAADFAALYGETSSSTHFAEQLYEGMTLESQLTGAGVVESARAAAEKLGWGLRGATVAIEGFGKVGAGAAKFFTREGARVVAVSTVLGAIHDPGGLDVERLLALRDAHGDASIEKYPSGRRIEPAELFMVAADVHVPGARPDAIHAGNVHAIRAKLIAPAANIPYGAGTIASLAARSIIALPDFVTNAGGVLAAMVGMQSGSADEAFDVVRSRVQANVHRVIDAARDRGIDAYSAGVHLAREALGAVAR